MLVIVSILQGEKPADANTAWKSINISLVRIQKKGMRMCLRYGNLVRMSVKTMFSHFVGSLPFVYSTRTVAFKILLSPFRLKVYGEYREAK